MAGTERYVRNSTADFFVFTKDSETDGIEVRVQDHEVWLTQKGIGQLFDVDCNLVRRTEKGRLRRRGWGLRWEKAQKGGKGTNLRGFFED